MRRLNRGILILVILLLATALGVGWLGQRDRELSEEPELLAPAREATVEPSTLAIAVTLPFEAMQQRANAEAPKNFSDSGHGKNVCKRILGIKHCAGTKYSFNATRGTIAVRAASDDRIHVEVPIKVRGKGGLRGDGAKILDLDGKNFKADLVAFADIDLALDENWCPKPTVKADFRWTRGARVEIVGGVWVHINSLVESALREQVQSMGKEVAKSIQCDEIQRQLAQVWAPRAYPVDLPGRDDRLFIHVESKSLAYSGLQTHAEAAELLAELEVDISVRDEAEPGTASPLPPLQRTDTTQSAVHLRVPLILSYSELERRLGAELVGKKWQSPTPAGEAVLEAKNLRIYPSGESLVVGTLVSVDLPDRLFDVNGWVYVAGVPRANDSGDGLYADDLVFTRALDNKLWSTLSVILESTLLQELRKAAAVDLQPMIEQASSMIVAQLEQPTGDLMVELGDPELRLGRLLTTRDHLLLEAMLDSGADVTLIR
ncbi:MAG: DUF4403 family protein [Acidobacteriota bacterium]|nr:DUF4403 family protein [Acidobacteriota bacterium]